jgi:hypothetical protein
MPADKSKKSNYQTLKGSGKNGSLNSRDQATLKPAVNRENGALPVEDLVNPHKQTKTEKLSEVILEEIKPLPADNFVSAPNEKSAEKETTFAEKSKEKKKKKRTDKDRELLEEDRWLKRNGHALTYVGLYLFSILVFFRPYELIPALSFCLRRRFISHCSRLPFIFRRSFRQKVL